MTKLMTVLLALSAVACGGGFSSMTQPDPISRNQGYMIGEMQRLEPMLGMGQFVVYFKEPPTESYAGWAFCTLGGSPPWAIFFNEKYIETVSPDKTSYMSALVAHEMCHHWVSNRGSMKCGDEKAVEECAYNLIANGRPN